MTGEILTVGTEILVGSILNTNCKIISEELFGLGINVYRQTTIGDNENRLKIAFLDCLKNNDLIILTGGLGPTGDDITKEVICKAIGYELEQHKNSKEHIENIFKKMGAKPTENNFKQSLFPKEAKVLNNHNGTANGMILEHKDKIIILLPGPPNECIPMFKNSVMPYIKNKSETKFNSTYLNFIGIGESSLETEIKDLIKNQTNPTIGTYGSTGIVTLRITEKISKEEVDFSKSKEVVREIKNRLGKYIYSDNNETIEQYIVKLLTGKNKTLSIAESCTGGMLASTLVNVSGASKILMESVVTYSNESKIKRLGVKKETLKKYGAVSSEVAKEMAQGVIGDSDIGVGITGVAELGAKEGDMYISICYNNSTEVYKYKFTGGRNIIRTKGVVTALKIIREKIIREKILEVK